jgi:hypothetical protein
MDLKNKINTKERRTFRIFYITLIVSFLVAGFVALIYQTNPAGFTVKDINEASLVLTQSKINIIKNDFAKHPEVAAAIKDAAEQKGLNPSIIAAILYMESSFEKSAVTAEKNYIKRWERTKELCESGQCNKAPLKNIYEACKKPGFDCEEPVYCEPGNALSDFNCKFEPFPGAVMHPRIGCSYGLGQMLYVTAINLGFTGKSTDLLKNKINIFYVAQLYANNYKKLKNDVDAIVAYNAGPYQVRSAKKKALADGKSDSFKDYVEYLAYPAHSYKYVKRILSYSVVFDDLYNNVELKSPEYYEQKTKQEGITKINKNNIKVENAGTYNQRLKKLKEFEYLKGIDITKLRSSTFSSANRFSFNLPYNYSEINIIKKDVKRILECKGSTNIEDCIKDKINTINSKGYFKYNYNENCFDTAIERFSYLAAIQLESCTNSFNDNCSCICDNSGYQSLSLIRNNTFAELRNDKIDLNIRLNAKLNKAIKLNNLGNSLNGVRCIIYDKGEFKERVIKSNDIHYCSYPNPTNYIICAETNNITFYDSNANQFMQTRLKYRFALDFSKEAIKGIGDYKDSIITYKDNSKGLITKVGDLR